MDDTPDGAGDGVRHDVGHNKFLWGRRYRIHARRKSQKGAAIVIRKYGKRSQEFVMAMLLSDL
jgi:hypothetical protein